MAENQRTTVGMNKMIVHYYFDIVHIIHMVMEHRGPWVQPQQEMFLKRENIIIMILIQYILVT